MAPDSASDGRFPGRRGSETGYHWVSSSPSPEVVARLEETFPEVVSIPVEELEAESELWQKRAVIARTFHRWIPADALIREFRRAGIQGEISAISMAFRCHILKFDSPEACSSVLQRPWVVNGQVVGTEAWMPEFSPAEDSVPTALMWMRLPNLPLEFWKESFLRAIVEPAGEFVCMDPATLSKSRGGFARVCIRVNLRRPLRPGVRVQGTLIPFWQQFSFESLEGVCMRCGTLHLDGPCLSPEGTEGVGSASDPILGSWLFAVRQRNGFSGPQVEGSGTARSKGSAGGAGPSSDPRPAFPGSRSGKAAEGDGWKKPVKVARRRPSLLVKTVAGDVAVPNPEKLNLKMKEKVTLPVPVQTEGAGLHCTVPEFQKSEMNGSRVSTVKCDVLMKNPFALLDSAVAIEGQVAIRDACPGPLKRARPEVFQAPRLSSKSEKSKGKGKSASSKVGGEKSFSPPLMIQLPCDMEGVYEMMGTQSVRGVESSSTDAAGSSKDLCPGSLSSVQPPGSEESVGGIEGQQASPLRMAVDDSMMSGGITDCVMVEDQGEVLASSAL